MDISNHRRWSLPRHWTSEVTVWLTIQKLCIADIRHCTVMWYLYNCFQPPLPLTAVLNLIGLSVEPHTYMFQTFSLHYMTPQFSTLYMYTTLSTLCVSPTAVLRRPLQSTRHCRHWGSCGRRDPSPLFIIAVLFIYDIVISHGVPISTKCVYL